MANRQHQTFRTNFHGINTRLVADALLPGKYPVAINVRADGDSKVKTRPGYNLSFATSSSKITDMRAYTALGTDNKPRIIVHDSAGGVWLDDGVKKGTVGQGGTGASLIPYRPSQSPQSWMYVCNATGYSKFSAPDASNNVTAQKVGIAEPQSPPDACPDGFQYTEFTNIPNNYTPGATATPWNTKTGDAGTPTYTTNPRSASGIGDTVVAIFQDPASVSPVTRTRYSVQLSSTTTYGVGETLIFNTNVGGVYQNSEVEDVLPAINGGVALTVLSIFYTSGLTGKCILVPSLFQFSIEMQLPDIRRGSLIQIGTEVCLVLNVTVGVNNGYIAIETSTTNHHGAGETLTGIPAIVVAGITSAVVGQTVGGAYIADTLTFSAGSGTLTQTLSTNPFTQVLGSLGTPQTSDYLHISLAASTPANITAFELDFDIGDGTFNQNVLSYSVPAASIASNFSGASQFSEIVIPISSLVRSVGNNPDQTLAQCTKVRIKVTLTATVSIYFGSLWVGGGGQLDIGTTGAPYAYRVRPRSTITGAVGNPSPETRYGVLPSRQPVILSLPSAAYDSQIDTWDIERMGGTVTTFRRVGSAPSTATTFTDNSSDVSALAGELLSFDNFEPWPSVDVPWTATVGVGGITSITAYGTALVVLGAPNSFLTTTMRWLPGTLITLDGQTAYTLWDRPTPVAGGVLFRTIENMGAPTVTTVFVSEPIVANQNLPYAWGPDANGVIFAAGDPLRPGALYSSTQFSPDATPNNIYDLTPPSEPLLGGEIIDGLSFVASSKRWWQLQAAFNTPQRWNPVEVPAGRGLAAPWGHCTDGKLIYFWASDGIYSMIPGLPALSMTDTDVGNAFPHGSVPGQNITYNGQTLYAPAYRYAARFRLSIINSTLKAHYYDSEAQPHTLILDMTLDSEGKPRMAWSVDVYADPIGVSYQPEQPRGTLLSTTQAYSQGYLADSAGKVYIEADAANDNGVAISCILSTPEWDGGDARVPKQFLDAFLDCIPVGVITITPLSGGTPVGVAATVGPNVARQLSINALGNLAQGFAVNNFLGLMMQWTDNFSVQSAPTTILEWTEEAVIQPILVRSWQSVPTSHGLQGYHFIYRIRFAYLSFGAVTLTITAFDGPSPQPITLPNTNGLYQKVEFVPTFNKGMLFTYQGTSALPWAPIIEDCEVLVGAWSRTGQCSVFTGLGGIEAA